MTGQEVIEILNTLSGPAQSAMHELVLRTVVDGIGGVVLGAALAALAWKLWHLKVDEDKFDVDAARFLARGAAIGIAVLSGICFATALPYILTPEGQAIHDLFKN